MVGSEPHVVPNARNDISTSEPASLELATPIKRAVTTYKGSARKKQAVKRPFTSVGAREDSDQEIRSANDGVVTLGEPSRVSARRRGEKPTTKSAKQATRKRKVSSPVGSEGSELTGIEDGERKLTDIEDGERGDGDQDDKKDGRAQGEAVSCCSYFWR